MSTPSTPQPSELAGHSQWFSENVHAHDSSLKSYVRSSFPHLRDIDDVVQESYLRLLRVHATRPIHYGKAFLFTIARNVAINLLHRQKKSPLIAVADLAAISVIDEKADVHEATFSKEEITLLAQGIDALPPRCREVFILRRIQGVPQKEIAARLGISEQTVQNQVQRGVKQCTEFFRRRGFSGIRFPATRR